MIKKVKKGFTLIELVVVIAVIAILSAVSVVAYVGITNSAKKSGAQQKATQVLTTIRAGVLASEKGYSGKVDTAAAGIVADTEYTVKLSGKLLSFELGGAELAGSDSWAAANDTDNNHKIVVILNDLIKELEENELSVDAFKASAEASFIAVDAGGNLGLQWLSF